MTARNKRDVEGAVVKLLLHKRVDRGMTLAGYESRCVRAGEIHELVSTDQRDAKVGDRIDRVGFLGFIEIASAGVVERGDAVCYRGDVIGTVLGFDECHFPNHYNILVAADSLCAAGDLNLQIEDVFRFENHSLQKEA